MTVINSFEVLTLKVKGKCKILLELESYIFLNLIIDVPKTEFYKVCNKWFWIQILKKS